MNNNAKILYIYDSKNEPGKAFVRALQKYMKGPEIALKDSGTSTLLFDIKKYDLVHFFFSASTKLPALVKKAKGQIRTVQTILSAPEKPEEYEKILFADHAVVFTDQEKVAAEPYALGKSIDCIPPCLELPPVAERQPSAKIRSDVAPGDRLLTVALGELSTQQQFMSLLYIVREYQRRGRFRLLLLIVHPTRETKTWKERLLYSIEKEKLTATTLLNDSSGLFSWIDSSDLFLYLVRHQDRHFSFPLAALQALSLGKPLLCYNVPPVNEVIRGFQPSWVCQNTEDVVRISVDISKEMVHLEQISTEVARYTQNLLSPESVVSKYQEIYIRLLKA